MADDQENSRPKSPWLVRLGDPLSELTRRERKMLLAVSGIGVVVAKTGLIPTQIESLGLTFSSDDQSVIARCLAVLIGYFLLIFIVYGWSDYLRWRVSLQQAMRDVEIDEIRRARSERRAEPVAPASRFVGVDPELIRIQAAASHARQLTPILTRFGRATRWMRLATPTTMVVRGAVEFVLPVPVAIYAVWCVLAAKF